MPVSYSKNTFKDCWYAASHVSLASLNHVSCVWSCLCFDFHQKPEKHGTVNCKIVVSYNFSRWWYHVKNSQSSPSWKCEKVWLSIIGWFSHESNPEFFYDWQLTCKTLYWCSNRSCALKNLKAEVTCGNYSSEFKNKSIWLVKIIYTWFRLFFVVMQDQLERQY